MCYKIFFESKVEDTKGIYNDEDKFTWQKLQNDQKTNHNYSKLNINTKKRAT